MILCAGLVAAAVGRGGSTSASGRRTRTMPFLPGVGEEDGNGEAGGDDDEEAEVGEGPGGVLAGAAAGRSSCRR